MIAQVLHAIDCGDGLRDTGAASLTFLFLSKGKLPLQPLYYS